MSLPGENSEKIDCAGIDYSGIYINLTQIRLFPSGFLLSYVSRAGHRSLHRSYHDQQYQAVLNASCPRAQGYL